MSKYIIKTRYEYMGSNGKTWTHWFVSNSTPMTKEEGESIIAEMQKFDKDIDKRTKLRHEHMLYLYDDFVRDNEEYAAQIKAALENETKYRQSQEYKDLQKRKRTEAKERKQRKQEYLKKISK